MNPFDQKIHVAKKKQRLFYIRVFVSLLISAVIILMIILASRGTRIEVKPDDAAIQASIHINAGVAMVIGETLYSILNNPAIAVSAEGFHTKTQVLDNNDFGKVMRITLKPLPAIVELGTNIDDDKTGWIIDGKTLATGNIFKYELPAGIYKLTVMHPHYHIKTVPLSLIRGETFKKIIEGTPIDGTITVNTKPSGASVSVNTVKKGLTPITLTVQGGYHDVIVAHDKYENINDTIEISRATSEVHRDYVLELKKTKVGVTLKPAGGKLSLDGIILKETDNITVATGIKHRLTYSKQGYFTKSETFNITARDTLLLYFELTKEMGMVDIESTPEAEVTLNGEPMGTTPLQLSLHAVPQDITLSKPKYRSVTKTIIPKAASSKKISVTLTSELTARLKEAPKLYTNKAGGRLKLFTPNDTFTMGAKRSEPGQRINEFIKEIKLTRPFYAGVYEVTNAQYSQYDKSRQGDPEKPVTSVSWTDAAGFCNWLSLSEGLEPVYHIINNRLQNINTNIDGYRLLTEAEWEWLVRKSGKSAQTTFVWGDERTIPKGAVNIADESAKGKVENIVSKYNDAYAEAAPVGSLAQEKSGLYDQGGNVSEWTHDSYSIVPPKSGKVLQDPFDSAMGNTHVVKGASWRSGSITKLRASFKDGLNDPRDDLGFRIGRYIYAGN